MPYAKDKNAMAKPHIRRANPPRGPLIWFCFKLGEGVAWGVTPRDAYGNWLKKRTAAIAALERVSKANDGQRIDLGRYAGTYGGTLPDLDASIYASWWSSICDYSKQIAIGFIIAAAATCWVASWMFSR